MYEKKKRKKKKKKIQVRSVIFVGGFFFSFFFQLRQSSHFHLAARIGYVYITYKREGDI